MWKPRPSNGKWLAQATGSKRRADSGVSSPNNCPSLSLPRAWCLHVWLSSFVILSAPLSLYLPPFFSPQVPPLFLQLLPILLDPAWHTSSGELSRSFQALSLGSLHSGTVLCPLGDTWSPHSAQGMLSNGRVPSPLPVHKHTPSSGQGLTRAAA